MLKTGDIIYKVTLEGYDIPCVVVKKYKVGQQKLLKNAGFLLP